MAHSLTTSDFNANRPPPILGRGQRDVQITPVRQDFGLSFLSVSSNQADWDLQTKRGDATQHLVSCAPPLENETRLPLPTLVSGASHLHQSNLPTFAEALHQARLQHLTTHQLGLLDHQGIPPHRIQLPPLQRQLLMCLLRHRGYRCNRLWPIQVLRTWISVHQTFPLDPRHRQLKTLLPGRQMSGFRPYLTVQRLVSLLLVSAAVIFVDPL